MLRESVFVCSYGAEGAEHVGHVLAWDDREAAELFARELEPDVGEVRVADIRVESVDGAALGE
ncbi:MULTISPECIES: hypothetical protein [Anaeromyxobacter]|uniref:hypothetical protein n=1 Tax=Anaeromyxobacter TaxID=161492 RepID=UPI001F55D05A|nr:MULTISPECIES: hypothetical protein [unclassified Anaeromyxobacter]